MTVYSCDKCGKQIDIDTNMVVLKMNSFQVSASKLQAKIHKDVPEYQLCVDCAMKVHRFIASGVQK